MWCTNLTGAGTMTKEIDAAVQKWMIAAAAGQTEQALKYYNQYLKLALEWAKKQ